MKKNKKKVVQRDGNILGSIMGETMSLKTKTVKDKSKYSRKTKHKEKY